MIKKKKKKTKMIKNPRVTLLFIVNVQVFARDRI